MRKGNRAVALQICDLISMNCFSCIASLNPNLALFLLVEIIVCQVTTDSSNVV